MNYPTFDDDAFPALQESWLVDLDQRAVSYRTYADSLNPPILHRKELLLAEDDPRRKACAALTESCEFVGLFDDPRRIGYQRQWLALIREKGYRLDGYTLVPLGNEESNVALEEEEPRQAGWEASRHLTALVRYGFSAPIQSLARYGFLDGRHRLFDYGCGRGDDVRGLGWSRTDSVRRVGIRTTRRTTPLHPPTWSTWDSSSTSSRTSMSGWRR
ncbi:hypothetical protein [Thiorhodococcus fuscus]|uniref:DNA phosphorothioation-associated methyltransferase n=1 Tax=Thiorhodococcus fuscus TaxID=527200 RepID=A0ABW4YDL7_9GAMM